MRSLLLIFAFFTISFSGVIEDLKPGEWLEIPNTKLYDSRAPEDSFQTALCGGIEGISGIINDWCSGAFDTKRGRLLIGPGGGHHGYSGNEVYAFDMDSLKWLRLTNPQPLISCQSERPNPDSFPGAMHTYDGLEYMPPPLDRHVVVDMWGGYPVRTFYSMDMSTLTWKAHRAMPPVQRTGDVSVYDSLTRRFFYGSAYSGKLVEWDPVNDTVLRTIWAGPFYYQNASIEPKRHLIVSVGNNAPVHAIPITVYPATMSDRIITPGGDKEFQKQISPGLEYDAVADKMVGWSDGGEISGFDVYALDIDENRWTKHIPSLSNSVTPGAENQWGTWGRWRYVPSKNVFVLYNDVRQNVFVYKFTSWKDTLEMDSIRAYGSSSIEQFLKEPLTVVAYRKNGTKDTVSNSCTFISLDTSVAVTSGFFVEGKNTGAAKIAIRKSTARGVALDTFEISIIATTALADSIKVSPDKITLLAGQTYQCAAIGYYYHRNQFFNRSVPVDASWRPLTAGTVRVTSGLISAITAGYVQVEADLDGKKDTIAVLVQPKPAFIKRINFSTHTNPFAYGWVSENAGVYSSTTGIGWVGPIVGSTARDDRQGTNYLLKSSIYSAGSSYKINAPDGSYIIKVAVGDNQYGGNDTVWYGTDVVLSHSGSSNMIVKDTVNVSGGNGLSLKVSGKICYVVAISNQGIDIDSVALDVPPFSPPDTLEQVSVNKVIFVDTSLIFVSANPNPFNPSVKIRLGGGNKAEMCDLSIVDVHGRIVLSERNIRINTLREGWSWNAEREQSGVYFLRIKMDGKQLSKRLLLVK